jgi:hypothetical protein
MGSAIAVYTFLTAHAVEILAILLALSEFLASTKLTKANSVIQFITEIFKRFFVK